MLKSKFLIKYGGILAALLMLGCTPSAEESRAIEVPIEERTLTGAELFKSKGCHACHRSSCPSLVRFSERALIARKVPNTRENLRQWLQDPFSIKYGTRMPKIELTDIQIDLLIDYIYTL